MKINTNVSIGLLFLSLLLAFLLYIYSLTISLNADFSSLILCLNSFAIIVFFWQKELCVNLKKQNIRIATIFTFGYVIVHYQLHLDYILGNFDESYSRFWVNPRIVPKSLLISSIGLISFFLGYSVRKQIKATIKNVIKNESYKKNDIYCSLFGFKLLTLFFLAAFLLTVNPLYIYGGYGIFEMGEVARFCSILFELSFTASLVQCSVNQVFIGKSDIGLIDFVKKIGYFQNALLVIYSVIVMISGDRGPIIYLMMGYIASYIYLSKWKVSIIKFIILFFLASSFISALVVIRNNEDSSTPIYEQVYSAILKNKSDGYQSLREVNSVSNSTLELATSVRTLHNAINNVPEENNFFYGQFQVLQLITVVPFGQLAYKNIFNIPDQDLTSAKYLTALIGGKNGSEGTSCIADIYLDFGLIGVVLILFYFGFYVRYLEFEVIGNYYPKLIDLIAFVIICQYAIYIPRATILFNFRNIVWVFVIIKMVRMFTSKRNIS